MSRLTGTEVSEVSEQPDERMRWQDELSGHTMALLRLAVSMLQQHKWNSQLYWSDGVRAGTVGKKQQADS